MALRAKFLPKKSRVQNEEVSLQITSLADIFIILLVFLLKSYSTSAVTITPTAGLKLPVSDAQGAPVEAIKVEVAESAVLIEGQAVLNWDKFKVDPADVLVTGASRALST